MKYLCLLILFLQPALALESGVYRCLEGNNNSICPQRIKNIVTRDGRPALKVTYIGDCEGMGSNQFFCRKKICNNYGLQAIEILNETSYQWENKAYQIKCHQFLLSRDP